MRVFVALACPEALAEEVARLQDMVSGVPGVRLLDAPGLHATVIPPWEEKDPDAVIRDFAAVDEPSLRLRMDRPVTKESRGGLSLALHAQATEAWTRLRLKAYRAILSHDPARDIEPHVTIARFPADAVLPRMPDFTAIDTAFDRLCLYESRGDLTYRVIGERKLAL